MDLGLSFLKGIWNWRFFVATAVGQVGSWSGGGAISQLACAGSRSPLVAQFYCDKTTHPKLAHSLFLPNHVNSRVWKPSTHCKGVRPMEECVRVWSLLSPMGKTFGLWFCLQLQQKRKCQPVFWSSHFTCLLDWGGILMCN